MSDADYIPSEDSSWTSSDESTISWGTPTSREQAIIDREEREEQARIKQKAPTTTSTTTTSSKKTTEQTRLDSVKRKLAVGRKSYSLKYKCDAVTYLHRNGMARTCEYFGFFCFKKA